MKIIIVLIYLIASTLLAQTDSLKPDYRNRINLPQYKNNILPLHKVSSGSGAWTEVNPKVPRVDYLGIHFINPETGWAVGAEGTILYSTNGGSKWEKGNSPTSNVLLKVHSYNGKLVVACGFNGIIIRSTDGGVNWFDCYSQAVGDLWEIKMLNDTLGWACGRDSSLLKTTDSGKNWKLVSTGYSNSNYWSLDYLDENNIYISSDEGNILRTANCGNSWEKIQTGYGNNIYTIVVFDSLRIVTGGQMGLVAFTFDGGITWHHSTAGGEIDAMAFVNDSLGFITGSTNSRGIYKTTNGGRTWSMQYIRDIGAYGLMFVNDSIGFNAGQNLVIKKTTDQGNNWNQMIIKEDFNDVSAISQNTAYAIGYSVYKTINGGESWREVFPADTILDHTGLSVIFFTDSLTGFVGCNYPARIYKTTDGAITWHQTNISGLNNYDAGIYDIFCINDSTCWATIGSPATIKTIDGGEKWYALSNTNNGPAIQFLNKLNGFSLSGLFFNKTNDGGATWNKLPLFNDNANVWDLYFKDSLRGWYSEDKKIIYTSDGGINWIEKIQDSQLFKSKFNWVSEERAFITGLKTYYTADSGNTWIDITEEIGFELTKMNSGN